ncbi:MAG: hypothetical protein NTZ17_03625 [Phycisphaerae bacterium]|nr:hypothetical protein [Phycisphaerae bacterium]
MYSREIKSKSAKNITAADVGARTVDLPANSGVTTRGGARTWVWFLSLSNPL